MVPKASERGVKVFGGGGGWRGKISFQFLFNGRYILDLAASLGFAGCARWWR